MSTRLGRPEKYPWSEWADGEEHEIKAGVDFDCTPESMGVLVRRTARVKRRQIYVSVSGDIVTFQFGEEIAA